jgi:hypothetical protein
MVGKVLSPTDEEDNVEELGALMGDTDAEGYYEEHSEQDFRARCPRGGSRATRRSTLGVRVAVFSTTLSNLIDCQ